MGTGGRGSGNQRDAGETPRGGLLGGAPLAVPMVVVRVSQGAKLRSGSEAPGLGGVLQPLKLRELGLERNTEAQSSQAASRGALDCKQESPGQEAGRRSGAGDGSGVRVRRVTAKGRHDTALLLRGAPPGRPNLARSPGSFQPRPEAR